MVCRLCLTKVKQSILIFSEEQIAKYIKKFLKLEILPEDPVSKVICGTCWQQLNNFQNFCLQIAEAQQKLNEGHTSSQNGVEPDKTTSEEYNKEKNFKENTFEADNIKHRLGPSKINESNRCTKVQKVKHNDHSKILKEIKATFNKDFKKDVTSQIVEDQEKADAKRKCDETIKNEQNNMPDKTSKSEKNLKAIQTRNDVIIQKHMILLCDICFIKLSDFTELTLHFQSIHQRKGYAVCCNKKFRKRYLIVDHINVHNNPEYFKCTDCGKVLSNRSALQRHVISFHQIEELKTFQCTYCPEKFPTQYMLNLHIVKHVPQNECTFICDQCGKGFPTNSNLIIHLKRNHSTVYDKMCEICAKLIRGTGAFKRHMEEHEGIFQPQVQCTECDSWFKNKYILRRHISSQHSQNDDKTHTCNICGKNMPSKNSLNCHIKNVHQPSRMFHCTYCDKSFKKNINLREHLTTHTGEVLYSCPHCPKTFNAKANMYSHRKKNHPQEWEANKRCARKSTD